MNLWVVRFFDENDELVMEETVNAVTMESVEEFAEAEKKDAGALYYNIS